MKKEVIIYKSKIFQEQVNSLTLKENNFAYKKCRTLVELIKSDLDTSHVIKTEKQHFELPIYIMKSQKKWRVILTLEPNNKLIFLRLVTLNYVEEAIENLNLDAITVYDFKEFWQ